MRLTALRRWLGRHDFTHGSPGEPVHDEVPAAGHPPTVAGAGDAQIAAAGGWPQPRIDIAESLWGEGCLWPGGADEILRVAIPLGLSDASSLLLVGGGSAAALRLAGDLGVWVTICESDPMLAAAAARRVQRAGVALAKRATVQSWTQAAPAFRRHGFSHAVAVEAMAGPRPGDALAALADAIRPGGQIALMETIAAAPLDRAAPAVAAWCRLEQREPPRAGSAWLTGPLERARFEVRIAEDITARQVRLAVAGWKRLVREMRKDRPPPRRAAALVAEAELWMRRIQLLRAGQLQVMRWHLTGPG
jgi:hypothetical protein